MLLSRTLPFRRHFTKKQSILSLAANFSVWYSTTMYEGVSDETQNSLLDANGRNQIAKRKADEEPEWGADKCAPVNHLELIMMELGLPDHITLRMRFFNSTRMEDSLLTEHFLQVLRARRGFQLNHIDAREAEIEASVERSSVTCVDIGANVEFSDLGPVLITQAIGRINLWTTLLCWILSIYKTPDLISMVKAMEMLPRPGGAANGVGSKENRERRENALWLAHYRETSSDRITSRELGGCEAISADIPRVCSNIVSDRRTMDTMKLSQLYQPS